MARHTGRSPPQSLKEQDQKSRVWKRRKPSWFLHSSLCFSSTSFWTFWPSRCAGSPSCPCVVWSFCSECSSPPFSSWCHRSEQRRNTHVCDNIRAGGRTRSTRDERFCLYLAVLGALLRTGLVLCCVVPTGGAVLGWGGQFVQQVSVQLLRLRQSHLQQEALHHQLLQLRAET